MRRDACISKKLQLCFWGGGSNGFLLLAGVALIASLALPSQIAFAEIKELAELVRDSDALTWANHKGETISFGADNIATGIARKETKPHYEGSPRGGYFSEQYEDKTIEITPALTLGREDTVIKGATTIVIPDMKRIQLEVAYDVMSVDSKTPGTMNFYVEIEERNSKDANVWDKTGTFLDEQYPLTSNASSIVTAKGQSFTSHDYVINLSKWRGKEIRINLVSKLPKSVVSPQSGRWNQARIVASSFDYMLDEPIVVSEVRGEYYNSFNAAQPKSKSGKRQPKNSPNTLSDYTVGSLVNVPINNVPAQYGDLMYYPDTPMTGVNLNGINFVYFSAHRYINPSLTEQGTFGFRFNGSADLWSQVSTLQNDFYRPGGLPYRFEYGKATATQSFDTYYLGFSSAIVGTNGQSPTIHALYHTEDVYSATGAYYDYDGNGMHDSCYSRIGYCRSTDGFNFTRMHDNSGNGDNVQGANPILTHWQPENEVYMRDYRPPDGTESMVVGVQGAGIPSIIESGDYYYMFYTRFLDTRNIQWSRRGQWSQFNTIPNNYPFYGYPAFISVIDPDQTDYFSGSTICLARALKSNINVSQSTYESNPNPWKKFYHAPMWNGSNIVRNTANPFSQDAFNGYDTGILPVGGHQYCKVSWNDYLNCYIMISHKYVNNQIRFFLNQSNGSDITSWTNTDIQVSISHTEIFCYPSLIGPGGCGVNEKLTSRSNILYYQLAPSGNELMVRRTFTFN